MNWENLRGKKVSILIDGFNKRESYIGVIKEVDDDFLILDMNLGDNPAYTIERVIVKKSVILSVWIYKEGVP